LLYHALNLNFSFSRIAKGHAINLGFISLFIILVCILRVLLWRENRAKQLKLEAIEAANEVEVEGRIGDRRLDFRYLL
jgi:hypothetical protein